MAMGIRQCYNSVYKSRLEIFKKEKNVTTVFHEAYIQYSRLHLPTSQF